MEDGSFPGVFLENPIVKLSRSLGKMTTIFQKKMNICHFIGSGRMFTAKMAGFRLSAANANKLSSQLV